MKKIISILLLFTLTLLLVSCGECTHVYTDGICTECGKECAHNYKDGFCTVCDAECPCETFEGGACTVCGYECKHEFVNSVCEYCEYECEHDFNNARCEDCGFVCTHTFENGKCKYCDVSCVHSFVNGECSICSYTCVHSYENGICSICNNACVHTYEGAVCSSCGTELPAAEALNGKSYVFYFFSVSWSETATAADKAALMTRFHADTEDELFDKLHMTIEESMLLMSPWNMSYQFISTTSVKVDFSTESYTYTSGIIKIGDGTLYASGEIIYTEIEPERYNGIEITVVYTENK